MYVYDSGDSKPGGVQRYQYQLNVLVRTPCQGCDFCKFPYKAKSTVRDDSGNFPLITYKNEDDVWGMIGQLYEEAALVYDNKGQDGSPIVDTFYQLPYFCCNNVVLDQRIQEDIQRYVFCEDTKVQAYPGTFGETPAKWVQVHFLLKGAMQLNELEIRKKAQREMKAKQSRKKGKQ